MTNTHAQLALYHFTQNHPENTTIRVSTKNDRGRWVTSELDPRAPAGTIYRFQAYKGRNILGHDLYEAPGVEAAPVDEATYIEPEPLAPAAEPLQLIERPAPVSGDPWLDLFRERMTADAVRIQELHAVGLVACRLGQRASSGRHRAAGKTSRSTGAQRRANSRRALGVTRHPGAQYRRPRSIRRSCRRNRGK